MDACLSFSNAVRALAEASLETAVAPGVWTRQTHPYARATASRLALKRSAAGAWAVVRSRPYGAAQTELFVSRLALYAGVPVAPTFLTSRRRNSHMLSVIPFSGIVYSTALPYTDMQAYLRHTSSCLPFFLWMGQDMDRALRNICLHADDRTSFAEFDFENTSLANVFNATHLDPAQLDAGLRNVYEMSYNAAVVDGSQKLDLADPYIQKPILRSAFADGMERLRAIPASRIDNVLDVVAGGRAVPERQRHAVKSYLSMRRFTLELAYRGGRLDRYLSDSLPEGAGIAASAFQDFTYRFA